MKDARVLLVSEDLALPPDEGLKKFVYSVADELREMVALEVISTQPSGPVGEGVVVARANLLMSGRELRAGTRSFNPTNIVYVPRSGGTRNAFIRSWRLGRLAPSARTAMVILQCRRYGPAGRFIARVTQPDLVVTQGRRAGEGLAAIGIASDEIPSGVDTRYFTSDSRSTAQLLRRKFDISDTSKVVLHVGHLKRERNVLLLARIRRELGCECIVVGSTSTVPESSVVRELEQAGVRIVDTYVEDIAALYRMSDCYVFPVHHAGNAIEMPLSVLEALACGVPIVSTPFGSLVDWLGGEHEAVTFCDSDDQIIRGVQRALAESSSGAAQAAERFSWRSVAGRLVEMLGASPRPVATELALSKLG